MGTWIEGPLALAVDEMTRPTAVAPPRTLLSRLAFTRMFTTRKTRTPPSPGGSNGTLLKRTEVLPTIRPTKALGRPGVVPFFAAPL